MKELTHSALTQWIQRNPDLLGWDSITAFSIAQANRLLHNAFIRRLSVGQDITGISGVIEVEQSDLAYHLAGYRLSALSMDIGRATHETEEFEAQIRLYGGTLVRAEQPYKVLSLAVHDELDGLAATQQWMPDNADGRLSMDIAKGQSFRLAVNDDSSVQAAAGHWLQTQLALQDQEKRDVVLAESSSDSSALSIGPVRLRGQTGSQGPALLLFASSRLGRAGKLPSPDDEFPYLLEQQATEDAAHLLNMSLLHRNSFIEGFTGLLDDMAFEEVRDAEGVFTALRATRGTLQIPSTRYQSRDYLFEGQAFELNALGGLVANFAQDQSGQRWQGTCTFRFSCLPNGADVPLEYTASFTLDLRHRFHLLAASDTDYSMLEGQFFSPWPQAQEATATQGLPDDADGELKAQAEDFAAYAVKQAILSAMSKQLNPRAPEHWLESMQLLGSGTLRPTAFEIPAALAAFGPLRAGGSFGLASAEVMLLPGARHTFVVENPPEGPLSWSLQSLPGGPNNPGTIDQQGVYRAPPQHTLQGRSGQVLVQVSDGLGAMSAALVTVRQYPLTANPFITTVHANGELVLTAAAMEGGALRWTHANEIPGESGLLDPQAQGQKCRYQAQPPAADKTYVHDEILVSSAAGGEPQSVHVLVIQRPPALVVALSEKPQSDGSLQFVALFNGRPRTATWRLAVGAGRIDENTGLYQPTSGSQTPGILVMATVESEDFGLLEGHQIMPLNTDRFPALSRQLVASSARPSNASGRA